MCAIVLATGSMKHIPSYIYRLFFVVSFLFLVSCLDSGDSVAQPEPAKAKLVAQNTKTSSQKAPVKALSENPVNRYQALYIGGKAFDSYESRGEKILFGFFRSTHKNALHMIRTLEALAPFQAKNRFRIFLVSLDGVSNKEKVEGFLKQNKITLPVLLDNASLDLATKLNVEHEVTFLGLDNQHIPAFGVKEYVFADRPDGREMVLAYLKQVLHIQEFHSTRPHLGIYPPAPDFTAKTFSGKTVKLSDYRGKAVLVIFFSPKCPHCQHEMTFLRDELYPKFHKQGFEVLAVSVLALTGETLKVYENFKFPWPVIEDGKRKIRNLFSRERSVPENYWITKEGKIRFFSTGFSDDKKNLYTMRLKSLLGLPNPPLLTDKHFNGVESCQICHEPQYVAWSVTPHAQAWETLQVKGEDANPECISCHSVGFNHPKGFRPFTDKRTGKEVVRVPKSFVDVQCENCHGLGGPHVATVDMLAPERLEKTCLECHTKKFSLHFDFDERLKKVNHSNASEVMKLSADERRALLTKVAKSPQDLFDTSVGYVGSEACSSCHATVYQSWRSSKHGHAFKMLEKVHKQEDANCLSCHSVGYGEPGGYQEHIGNKSFQDVGCESCHGPGGKHILSKKKDDIRTLGDDCPFCVIEQICLSCHDEANDPDFNIHQALEAIQGHK